MSIAGNERVAVGKGCELLLKILDAILSQPEEEKFRKIRTVCMILLSISIDTHCSRPW